MRLDTGLILLWLGLLGFGLVIVTSASLSVGGEDPWHLATRHGVYLAASVGAFCITLALPVDLWRRTHRLAILVAFVALVVVLIPGIGTEVNGARRWIRLGPVSLQVAEGVKLLFVVYLAGYLNRFHDRMHVDRAVLVPPVLALGALCVLLVQQPDFGSVVVLAAVTATVLFMGGAKLRYFLALMVAGAAVLGAVAVEQPYRLARVATFLDPWESAFGTGYQLTQSLIAFGRGETFGLGLGDGVQKLFYLPEAHNDFIFAVVAEEFGLLGCTGLLFAFAWLVLRMFRVARRCVEADRAFAGYLSYGATVVIAVQFLINVGVSTGMLPTKGLTLPFISYGGNSLVVCTALLALVVRADAELAVAQTRRGRGVSHG